MVNYRDGKCPGCGGETILNPTYSVFKCIFCGREYPTQEAINLARIDGIQTSAAALTRAYQKLDSRNPDAAMADFKHVIDLMPTCAEAHYGCFICALFEAEYYRHLNQHMKRNLYDYIENLINASENYGDMAVKYATTDEERSKYQSQIDAVKAQARLAMQHIEYGEMGYFQKRKATVPSQISDLQLIL